MILTISIKVDGLVIKGPRLGVDAAFVKYFNTLARFYLL